MATFSNQEISHKIQISRLSGKGRRSHHPKPHCTQWVSALGRVAFSGCHGPHHSLAYVALHWPESFMTPVRDLWVVTSHLQLHRVPGQCPSHSTCSVSMSCSQTDEAWELRVISDINVLSSRCYPEGRAKPQAFHINFISKK